jgi:PIN domain nuclease of toxin-antitoxin system
MGIVLMVILDTHAWIWYVTESKNLSKDALDKILFQDVCGVSAISVWEVAMLEVKGRIKFKIAIQDWIEKALAFPKIKLFELIPEISISSANLAGFHGDPADRIIYSTALINNSQIITKDKHITKYNPEIIIW